MLPSTASPYCYDVAYIGAGPFGITAACTLRALNNRLRIIVVDKRPQPVRNHGLNTAGDSVDFFAQRINSILAANLSCTQREAIIHLRDQFEFWKKKFIRTTDIENILGEFAKSIGIIVVRSDKCEVNAEEIPDLLNPTAKTVLSHSELVDFLNAEVIVGGDGAKSAVRNGLFDNRLAESQTLQYMIELKYQTDGHAVPRETKESLSMASSCGAIGIESMNRNPQDKDKPVTLHSFVKKELYDSLRIKDSAGNLKGIFANPWTIDELKERAKESPHANEVYVQILRYLHDLGRREGICKDAKISTLDLTIYRSERAVIEYKGHYVLLGGDAFSGMVLERGWNKAIMEAIISAIAIHNFFQSKDRHTNVIPLPFQLYEREIIRIYENEKWWALKKDTGISMVNFVAGLFKQWVFEPINTIYETKALLEKKTEQLKKDVMESSAYISSKMSNYSSLKESK